jgi:hypothetical protein
MCSQKKNSATKAAFGGFMGINIASKKETKETVNLTCLAWR